MLHLTDQGQYGGSGTASKMARALFFEERLPRNLMRLVYFDEAGIGSINDEPITTVGGS
jgi:hypothetical protein